MLALTIVKIMLVYCSSNKKAIYEVFVEWLIGRVKFNVNVPKLEFVAADSVELDYLLVYYNVVTVYMCKNVKYDVDSH